MRFHKLHGLGNDFIVFDGIGEALPGDLTEPRRVVALCDRHRGVGGDGVLLLQPSERPGARARMRVINADGSEPEMCGNGLRCAALLIWQRHRELVAGDRLVIDTGQGPLRCQLRFDSRGAIEAIRVEVGEAVVEEREQSLSLAPGVAVEGTVVRVGNPHFVVFCDGSTSPRQRAESWGPQLEVHPRFPRRTNVEFARLHDDRIELWVWERGCGLTRACGTGACATALAALELGLRPTGVPIAVDLPGGRLIVERSPDRSEIWIEGPAEAVFVGEIP